VSFAPSKPHGYWRWPDHTAVWTNFKKEMRVGMLSLVAQFVYWSRIVSGFNQEHA
jgi:hypothetical protein